MQEGISIIHAIYLSFYSPNSQQTRRKGRSKNTVVSDVMAFDVLCLQCIVPGREYK